MSRGLKLFLLSAFVVYFVDQSIKQLFVGGFGVNGSCVSLELYFNTGVAFSMLAFLGEKLKYIQAFFIAVVAFFVLRDKHFKNYPILSGILIGAALGNLSDRFVYGGVVDYVAWHCGFNFAIFNFADVMIDVAIGLFLLYELWWRKRA